MPTTLGSSSHTLRREEGGSGATSLPLSFPLALVPNCGAGSATPGAATPGSSSRRNSSLLHRRRCSTLGSLQPAQELPALPPKEPRQLVPGSWRPPSDNYGGGLERTELGLEATSEVRRWLLGDTSGLQCSQVVLDRALTVLSNFKLASGCQLEVLGGPLGALVGGYSDADWLYDEVFQKHPADAIADAFAFMGFPAKFEGDWSCVAVEEVSLVYRRMCLRGHPSRGGSPRAYLKIQVSMEVIRAFSGEDTHTDVKSTTSGYVLNDLTLAKELQLSSSAEGNCTPEELEELNRALDEYILRQMCFKSEIVDEIARLHEDSAYAILGVSSQATDSEIKKAYRLIAMQCHPDKGGDKEDFQELTNAYEKIMAQRQDGIKNRFCNDDEEEKTPVRPKRSGSKKREEQGDGGTDGTDGTDGDQSNAEKSAEEKSPGERADQGEMGEDSDAALVEKARKAAEEASRYAKTAAEFAHQAAEAAEAARKDQASGSRDAFTKSIAHSAIVYTLTVVKAVRAVGYATLDVAAHCRSASKRNVDCKSCGEHAVSAMSLGLEALSSALACAEVTETTAAELQASAPPDGGSSSERFVGAAVRASMAAASASNAAMASALAAVEGSRRCAEALESRSAEEKACSAENSAEEFPAKKSKKSKVRAEPSFESEDEEGKAVPKSPTPEEVAATEAQRLSAQRSNNQKVLQRLNAEILAHQRNVRKFLQANRQLIPDVSGHAKHKVFHLLRDYAMEARVDLLQLLLLDKTGLGARVDGFCASAESLQLLVPFLQPQCLAIPVSVKARVLKMAGLYDLQSATRLLDQELFRPLSAALSEVRASSESEEGAVQQAIQRLDGIWQKVRQELCSNVAEEPQ